MVEKYIGFSVAVSNGWLGSAYDKKSPKMVIIAKERCNPKLMSRVMADVPFSTTCVFPLLGAAATNSGIPCFGYRSSENAYLRIYMHENCCQRFLRGPRLRLLYVCASYEFIGSTSTGESLVRTLADWKHPPARSKCSTEWLILGPWISNGHAKKKVALHTIISTHSYSYYTISVLRSQIN